MNRLTIKNSDGTYSQPTHTTFEKMFYRLAEFEDFLEEQGFESFEKLKELHIKYPYHYSEQYMLNNRKLKAENQSLKNNWQELRKYVEKYADNFDEGIASVCDLILMKMQELEQGVKDESLCD